MKKKNLKHCLLFKLRVIQEKHLKAYWKQKTQISVAQEVQLVV